jgi:hypothetical protein
MTPRHYIKNLSTIDPDICKDSRLSWTAKGIWLYAFSVEEGSAFQIKHLIKASTDDKASVIAGLLELEACGYLLRKGDTLHFRSNPEGGV